jgi:hypothetical protein
VYRRGVDLLQSPGDTWLGGHGTQTAGVLVGGWAGHHATTGMAPGAELLVGINRYSEQHPATIGLMENLAWAAAEGADVINIEDGDWIWQYLDGSSNLETLIDELAAGGTVVVVPAGNAGRPDAGPIALPADGSTITTPDYSIYSNLSVSPRGTRRLDLALEPIPPRTHLHGTWRFRFTGPVVEVHGYNGEPTWNTYSSWGVGTESAYTVTSPATADSAITVGAYNTRGLEQGSPVDFSSHGPRVDGHPVVDILAPGAYVLTTGPGGFRNYVTYAGTSAAAPFVAGAGNLSVMGAIARLLDDMSVAPLPYSFEIVAGPNPFNAGAARRLGAQPPARFVQLVAVDHTSLCVMACQRENVALTWSRETEIGGLWAPNQPISGWTSRAEPTKVASSQSPRGRPCGSTRARRQGRPYRMATVPSGKICKLRGRHTSPCATSSEFCNEQSGDRSSGPSTARCGSGFRGPGAMEIPTDHRQGRPCFMVAATFWEESTAKTQRKQSRTARGKGKKKEESGIDYPGCAPASEQVNSNKCAGAPARTTISTSTIKSLRRHTGPPAKPQKRCSLPPFSNAVVSHLVAGPRARPQGEILAGQSLAGA